MGLESILRGNFLRQALHLAAGSNVREPNFIGERSDKFIPPRGKGAGDAILISAETGENKESAIGQIFLPIRCEAHFFQTAGGTDDDGLTAAQENAKALFFHR